MTDSTEEPTSPQDEISGTRIKEWRNIKQLTLEQLADSTKMSVSYLSRMENGKRNVSFKNLNIIASSLNITPRQLMPHTEIVPLFGYLDTGGKVQLDFDPKYRDRVESGVAAQENSTSNTLALLVKDAMGPLLNMWVVYFEIEHNHPDDYFVNKTCFAEIKLGDTLMVKVMRKVNTKLFHLTSIDGSTLLDAEVVRFFPIGALVPPVEAFTREGGAFVYPAYLPKRQKTR